MESSVTPCRRTRAVLPVLLALLPAAAGSIWGAEQNGRARELTLSGDGGGKYRLSLKTSGPVPASSCSVREEGDSRQLVLELQMTDSALKPTYNFPGMPLGTVKVTPLPSSGGGGVRVEVPLQGTTLWGWKQTDEGIDILLSLVPGSNPSALEPYRLGTGDRIELAVFGHEDLKQVLEVLADGSVVFPLAGVLPVAGKSLLEVRGEVQRRLKEYLVDPQVSLDIKDYRSQPVNVVGEVENPGQYFLKGPTTLIDIVAQAGWMTKDAGNNITITRDAGGGSQGSSTRQIVIRREDLLGGSIQQNPRIQRGDIVTVGPKQYFYIRGEVIRPGQFPLEDHPTLMKAMSIAQGLTPYARKKGIELHRTVNGVPTKREVDLKAIEDRKIEDIPLMPDDLIIVPRRLF